MTMSFATKHDYKTTCIRNYLLLLLSILNLVQYLSNVFASGFIPHVSFSVRVSSANGKNVGAFHRVGNANTNQNTNTNKWRTFSTAPSTQQKETLESDDYYYSSQSPPMRTKAILPSDPVYGPQKVTLTRYLSGLVQEQPELRELESLLLSVSMACKTISNLINRGNINQQLPAEASSSSQSSMANTSMQQYSMKKLDQLSTQVLRNALRFTGKVSTITPARENTQSDSSSSSSSASVSASSKSSNNNKSLEQVVHLDDGPSQHQPGVLIASAIDSKYVAFFDPLDGSGNADATICTGTIFGMLESNKNNNNNPGASTNDDLNSVLQPGKNLKAAGYCLYSSATILVFSVGNGTHGFTLDPQLGEFVLTHPSIQIPSRGTIYSCNEANSDTWPEDVQTYLSALKSGNNRTNKKYTQRYVGSMVGDIHRTLMYGGIFFYPQDEVLHPRGNLQLLYKCAPLAYLVAQAGGDSTNGKMGLLDVKPTRVHARSPCFIGSQDDIDEMKTYVKHNE